MAAALGEGHAVQWMDDGRNPEIQIEWIDGASSVEVTVFDHAMSGSSVRVAMLVPDGWISDHYGRLQRVRDIWPSEVIRTDYGALAWRPAPIDDLGITATRSH